MSAPDADVQTTYVPDQEIDAGNTQKPLSGEQREALNGAATIFPALKPQEELSEEIPSKRDGAMPEVSFITLLCNSLLIWSYSLDHGRYH
jgi:hypothetical protein